MLNKQHLNTEREWARHLADTGGGLGIELPTLEPTIDRYGGFSVIGDNGHRLPWKTVIEHADEDPEIRSMFQEESQKKGIKFAMPPVIYQT